jgi:phosphate transport system substrate-binding protein
MFFAVGDTVWNFRGPARERAWRELMNNLYAAVMVSSMIFLASCGGTGNGAASGGETGSVEGEVSVVGSTTVQPVAERLAEAYEALHPGVTITVQGGGSSVGVTSAGQGSADIGTVSREISQDELEQYPSLVVHTFARDGIAIIADPGIPVGDLSLEQVRGIFSGSIVNWSVVGGSDTPIVVVSREEGSGTRSAFEELVLGEGVQMTGTAILQPSNGAILNTVSSTPGSIGYLSFGYLDSSVKTISIGGVSPAPENAADGTYPVVRPLNLVTNGEVTGAVRAWIDFILSPDGQAVVVEEGYLPVAR